MVMSGISAGQYEVRVHGVKLGEIDTLKTLEEYYLKAEATNFITRLLLGHDYFVLYSEEKPDIDDAKFKKDNNMMLYAFKEAIDNKPKKKTFQNNRSRELKIECAATQCDFVYTYKKELRGEGFVKFNEKGEFMIFREEVGAIEIARI